jgi:hypothetical protein
VTYQALLKESEQAEALAREYDEAVHQGAVLEAQKLLIRLGRRSLGEPSAGMRNAIEHIHDVDWLEELVERLFDISTWNELLAEP